MVCLITADHRRTCGNCHALQPETARRCTSRPPL